MLRLVLPLLLLAAVAAPAAAQPATAERVPAAEAAFEEGLGLYRAADFDGAYAAFLRAATEFGYNQKTTAARLMAGKAAYAAGEVERATATLDALLANYPGSRYAAEAERVAELARTADVQRAPLDLGVILPAGGDDGYLGQALFNGIRLAVEEHNRTGPRQPVRLVFRTTPGSPAGAMTAFDAAVQAGADVVVGPLYSDEAIAAGGRAEEAGVPLLAPLATDQGVSAGRRLAFQANPTFPERGRAMARYAVSELGLRRLGVVVQTRTFGENMGAAFAAEASRLGAAVVFQERLDDSDGWADLDREVGVDKLQSVQAVYLPVTGGDAPEYAADALRALEGLPRPPRPLGNTEWEALGSSRARASRLGALFTTDFFPSADAVARFDAPYRALAGIGPDRLALLGYDIGTLLVQRATAPGAEGALADRIRSDDVFQGAAHRFDFEDGQINGALFVLAYRDGQPVLVD